MRADYFDAANDVAKQESLYGTVDIDSTARHFKHMLIGYRDWILYDEDIRRFPPSGARDKSWRIGMEMAQRNLVSKTLDRCR